MLRVIMWSMFALSGVVVWMMLRPVTPAPSVLGVLTGQNTTDQAIANITETGASWYDYWKSALGVTYASVGRMPIEGTATPIAESP